jgi:hypothetical protein
MGSSPGVHFPVEVARLGAAHDGVTAEHLRRLEERLKRNV